MKTLENMERLEVIYMTKEQQLEEMRAEKMKSKGLQDLDVEDEYYMSYRWFEQDFKTSHIYIYLSDIKCLQTLGDSCCKIHTEQSHVGPFYVNMTADEFYEIYKEELPF